MTGTVGEGGTSQGRFRSAGDRGTGQQPQGQPLTDFQCMSSQELLASRAPLRAGLAESRRTILLTVSAAGWPCPAWEDRCPLRLHCRPHAGATPAVCQPASRHTVLRGTHSSSSRLHPACGGSLFMAPPRPAPQEQASGHLELLLLYFLLTLPSLPCWLPSLFLFVVLGTKHRASALSYIPALFCFKTGSH